MRALWVRVVSIVVCMAGSVVAQSEIYERSVELAQLGQVDDAIGVLTNYVNETEVCNDERILLGRMFDYVGEPGSSIKTLRDGLNGSEADLDLLAELLALYERMAEDGPTVSYKRGSVCYSPSKDKEKEDAFKAEHLQLAVETCEKAVEIMPNVVYFEYHLALLKEQQECLDEATSLLEELEEAIPEDPTFKNDLGRLYWSQGMTNKALSTLKAVIEIDGSIEDAQTLLSEIYEATGDLESAEKTRQQAEFFQWVPGFVDLNYTPENYELYRVFSGQTIPQGPDVADAESEEAYAERGRIIQERIQAADATSLRFLAALCFAHSDHGGYESDAFAALEANPEEGIPLLLNLLQYGDSTCTMGQAAAALARLKVPEALDMLLAMLPQDTRFVWDMDIAECLARMGDERAIPELIRFADVTQTLERPDDDPMNGFAGHMAARFRAIIALGAFEPQKDRVSEELLKGTQNEQVALACYAALYRLTGEEKWFEEIRMQVEQDADDILDLKIAVSGMDDARMKNIAALYEEDEESDLEKDAAGL